MWLHMSYKKLEERKKKTIRICMCLHYSGSTLQVLAKFRIKLWSEVVPNEFIVFTKLHIGATKNDN